MPGTLTRETLTVEEDTRRDAEQVVDAVDSDHVDGFTLHVQGRDIELPGRLSKLVFDLLQNTAAGHALTVESMPEELTTTAAADMLGVSRPTLMKLIAAGEVPSHKVGTHTRLKAAEVIELRARRAAARREALDDLRALEQELPHTSE